MKGNIRSFVSGCIVMGAVVGLIGTAAATIGQRTATLNYANIKVELNGQKIDLVDANGQAVEPFTIDGTTYLPVRAVSNALGLGVEWDQATNTVLLSNESKQSKIVSNEEIRSILVLDQISDQLYTLGWQIWNQMSIGANSQEIFEIYWDRFMDRFGYYDEQNDFMPESTYEYQFILMDEFEAVEAVYNASLEYSLNSTTENLDQFANAFSSLELFYNELQNALADYFVTTFPLD